MHRFFLPLLLSVVIVSACGNSANSSKSESIPVPSDSISSLELPFPVIPENLQTGQEKADYMLAHFWDAMDFTDTVRSHSQAFIEQNFVNFISFFSYGTDNGRKTGVENMLRKASADAGGFKLVAEVADLYLYEPNSPYFSEDYYILFLRQLIDSPLLDEGLKERVKWQLESAMKNRPGDLAADFSFTTLDGKKYTLSKWNPGTQRILLLFFDPDCDTCNDTLQQLMESVTVNNLIKDKKLAVLAIDPDYNEKLWRQKAASFPTTWTTGYEKGKIDEEDLYVLRALPSLYLLDGDKKIILKDVALNDIINFGF